MSAIDLGMTHSCMTHLTYLNLKDQIRSFSTFFIFNLRRATYDAKKWKMESEKSVIYG